MIKLPKFPGMASLNKWVKDWAKKNTVKIDNRDWYFAFLLDNGKEKFLFTKSGITDFVLEDDVFSWYSKGYITFKNNDRVLERTVFPKLMLKLMRTDPPYKMRGDGRDLLSINFSPKVTAINSFIAKTMGLDIQPDPEVYNLDNTYAIYDCKTEYDEGGDELKTLYFWDIRYQQLLERNVHYSTGLTKCKTDPKLKKEIRQSTNKQRSIKSGIAIKEFLKVALKDTPGSLKFDDKWDEGEAEIFYSSPAQYKGVNDLDWLMDCHVSAKASKNDMSILKYDTYIKKWTLMPVFEYFGKALKGKEAGDFQHDKFTVAYNTGNIPKFLSLIPNKKKSPTYTLGSYGKALKDAVKGKIIKQIELTETSELELVEWRFEDLVGLDNQNLITTYAVHSYNMEEKEFNVDVYKNEIQTVTENFQKDYLEKNFMAKAKPLIAHNITKGKRDRSVMNNLFTLSNDEKLRLIKGRNQLYKNLIFLNNACNITIKGNTHRRTGRFFSIDRRDKYFENDYDNKVLGQYFIVNVKHRFSGETYTNEILGVKPYRFAKLSLEQKNVIK